MESVSEKKSVLNSVVLSLLGGIYTDQGAQAARDFIHTHILSRSVDMENHVSHFIGLSHPKTLLRHVLKTQNRIMPVSR